MRIIFFCFLILSSKFLLAQKNYRIVFSETSDKPDTKKYEKARFDSVLVYDELNALVKNLRSKSYISANIDSLNFRNDTVLVTLHKGKPFSISEIRFPEKYQHFNSKFGYNRKKFKNTFTETKLQAIHNRLISYYENIGFPFAYTQLTELENDSTELKIGLTIKKNNFITFDSLVVKSKVKVSHKFLQTYLQIKSGTPYSEKIFRDLDFKIQALNYISLHRSPEIEFSDKKADVYLYLKKKPSSSFSGILGFIPAKDENAPLLLTGELNLFLQNMLQHGEYFSFNWQKYQALSQKLNLEFSYPYLFNIPFGFDAGLNIRKQDSTYLNLKSNTGISYFYNSTNYVKLFYESQNTSLLQKQNTENIGEVNLKAFGTELFNSSLDNNNNPRKGYTIKLSFSTGNKKTESDSTQARRQFESNFSVYLPVFSRMTIHLGNTTGIINTPALYQNELFRLGGIKDLRGFDNESIFASAYTIANIEWRYLFEENSNFFLFYNQAFYESKETTKPVNDRPLGFGAGISFQTRAGLFSLVYAVGKQQNSGINVAEAKIHFGYISRF